jgi:hypothetical protein
MTVKPASTTMTNEQHLLALKGWLEACARNLDEVTDRSEHEAWIEAKSIRAGIGEHLDPVLARLKWEAMGPTERAGK